MLIDCGPCKGTGTLNGSPCGTCGGDGKIDLTDEAFRGISLGDQIALRGTVWDSILTSLADLTDKCNDIKEKVDEIKEVVDGL